MSYAELQITTNFSFLRGASHPEELVAHAATLNYTEIAITDRNTYAGLVRAHAAAKKKCIRIIPGVRLDLIDGPSLLAYPKNIHGYSSLSNLLTHGNLRTEKGKCDLYKENVFECAGNVVFIVIPPSSLNNLFDFDESFKTLLHEYRRHFSKDLYIAATRYYMGDDAKYLHRLSQLSEKLDIPMVATNDVHYHDHERRQLQDILTCVREKCTIYNAGYLLHPNAERFMKPIEEMERLFRKYPEAIQRTKEIATLCTFSLDELKYEYPEEITTNNRTPLEELDHLVQAGAHEHFGDHIPEKITSAIQHEMAFIKKNELRTVFFNSVRHSAFCTIQKHFMPGPWISC